MSRKVELILKELNRQRLIYFFPGLFMIIGLLGTFNHSLWRDEMQGWLVAWKSSNFVDLWSNNAPSGHPILWSALIFLTKNITGTPFSMQLLHWSLGSLAIIIFWKWNPMSVIHKTLFTFGYFPFWEYFFISRHYVLAELFTFIFCSSYSIKQRSYIPASIIIGLLFNSHAFSWAIAFACFCTLVFDWIFNPTQRREYLSRKYWNVDLIVSILILFTLFSFAFYSLIQVSDSVDIASEKDYIRHLLRVFGRIFGGYFLIIPDSSKWFDLVFCFIVALAVIAITLSFLSRSRSASVFFISGTLSLFLFNYFVYIGFGSRHYGYYLLFLIASIWIAINENEANTSFPFPSYSRLLDQFNIDKIFKLLLTFSLSIHFAAGIHRVLYDFYLPYSAAKQTAKYIRMKGWQDQTLFGTRDVELTTVSGYLDRDIYYPEIKRRGSYTEWNNRNSLERENTLIHIQNFFSSNKDINKALIILSHRSAFRELKEGEVLLNKHMKIVADKKFERSWIVPERYYLYWVNVIDRK